MPYSTESEIQWWEGWVNISPPTPNTQVFWSQALREPPPIPTKSHSRVWLPGPNQTGKEGKEREMHLPSLGWLCTVSPKLPSLPQSWWSSTEGAMVRWLRTPLLPGTLSGMKFYNQTSPGRDKAWPVHLCFSRENSTAINPVTPGALTPDAGIAGNCWNGIVR